MRSIICFKELCDCLKNWRRECGKIVCFYRVREVRIMGIGIVNFGFIFVLGFEEE